MSTELSKKTLWAGTTNKGKLQEFRLLIGENADISLRSIDEIPSYYQPPENGQSFIDNARIKAKSLKAMKLGEWVFAEDSGLEVRGLGNLPGIHSARYAGPHASDSENIAKLLKMLTIRQVADRSAKFVCTVVAFDPQGTEHVFQGEMAGKISTGPKGQLGFGYDPVFIPHDHTQTLAELGPGFKVQHSHRTLAFKQLLHLIRNH